MMYNNQVNLEKKALWHAENKSKTKKVVAFQTSLAVRASQPESLIIKAPISQRMDLVCNGLTSQIRCDCLT